MDEIDRLTTKVSHLVCNIQLAQKTKDALRIHSLKEELIETMCQLNDIMNSLIIAIHHPNCKCIDCKPLLSKIEKAYCIKTSE
jgi:hypothetical protein